jgi:hypothetical protein
MESFWKSFESVVRHISIASIDHSISNSTLIVILIFFLVGVFLFCFEIISVIKKYRKTVLKHDQIKEWPTTIGTILDVKTFLERTENVPDLGVAYIWNYKIRYSFTINGNRYISNKVTYDRENHSGEFYNDDQIEDFKFKMTEKYPINSDVRIYYNPDAPENCCLQPCNMSKRDCVGILFLMLFALSFMLFVTTQVLIYGNLLVQTLFFVGLPVLTFISYWYKYKR